jgi:hypothetical protein
VAILAALIWAPSIVLAAPPNALSSPAVTPTSATTLTPVSVSVHYTSTAGNAATGVFASIGPLEVSLTRVGGTAVNGTWSATTLAPVGTWRVTFRATASQGPQPTIDGPLLTVTATSTPTAAPGSANPAPPVESSIAPSFDGSGSSATASPDPPAAPVASGGAAGPVASPTANAAPGAPASSGGGARAAPAATRPPAADGSQHPGRAQRPSGAAAATAAPAGLPEGIDGAVAGTDLVVLLSVILGATAMALLGTGWLVVGRDRASEDELAAVRSEGAARRAGRPVTSRELGEDPVIAAMLPDGPPRHGRLGKGPWAARTEEDPTGDAPRRRRGRRG